MAGYRSFEPGCDEYHRLNRRDFLKVGSLGLLGISMADLFRLQAATAAKPKKDISCVLIWLRGGPSTIDLWDLKPEAPADIRGEFKPIKTNVDGIEIGELLPLTAKHMDALSIVRSVYHNRGDHEGGQHYMATGNPPVVGVEYPGYGAIISHELGPKGCMPPFVHLPEEPKIGRAGLLAAHYGPFNISTINDPDLKVKDVLLSSELTQRRLDRRLTLRQTVDALFSQLDKAHQTASVDTFYKKAYELLSSPKTREAFDITKEPDVVRDRYGRPVMPKEIKLQGMNDISPNDFNRSIIGQGLLMARRLVEAGVRFVTVVGRGWDTHVDNFNRLKTELLPYFDRALAAFLQDLKERGLWESTVVMISGDFNRTPKINSQAGRDHWPYVMSVVIGGGGIKGGMVVGSSDERGEFPKDRPVKPEDIAATLYHLFGIDHTKELHSPIGRPFRILPEGAEPIYELV